MRARPYRCATASARSLDLGVGVPARRPLFQDQVNAHAAAREVLHAVVVFGAVGVRVEVARAVVADVLEELDEEERCPSRWRRRSGSPDRSGRAPGRSDRCERACPASHACATAWRKFSPAICSCATSGFTPTSSGVRERRDEARGSARSSPCRCRRAARSAWPRARSDIRTSGRSSTRRDSSTASRRRLTASSGRRQASVSVPSRPPHSTNDLGAQLGAQIHRAHRLLHRVGAHARVVGGEGAVAEDRVVEEIHGRHRHDQVVLLARPREVTDDPITLGGRGIDRHEVVVVKVHAPCADLAEQRGGVDRRRAGRTASPKGSRPRLPTVQRPNVNLSSGRGRCHDRS